MINKFLMDIYKDLIDLVVEAEEDYASYISDFYLLKETTIGKAKELNIAFKKLTLEFYKSFLPKRWIDEAK